MHVLKNLIKSNIIQTIINALTMLGTLYAAKVAAKALSNQTPLMSFVVGKIQREQDQESKGYRIDVTTENVGYSSANVMVIDAVSPDIHKAEIGVPTILDKSTKSNISIWLKEKNKPVKVVIALYYLDIRHKRCFRTVCHVILNYTEDAPQDVFRIEYQKADTLNKKRIINLSKKVYKNVPERILQWAGERKQREEYFTEDWLEKARSYVSSEISPIIYYK